MQSINEQSPDFSAMEPVMAVQSAIIMILAIVMGAIMAAVLLPAWLPGLSASLLGTDLKVYWYLSRGTAMVSFGLLWLSMVLGLMITNKLARLWPGGPIAFDLHQFTSVLGLGFAVFHALILLGDQYIGYGLVQILAPFTSTAYKPFWVGLGQTSIYLWAVVAFSFYVRKQIGTKVWRAIHFLSFASLALALLHGIASGTDSATLWAARMYWFAGGSILFLAFFRILASSRLFPAKTK